MRVSSQMKSIADSCQYSLVALPTTTAIPMGVITIAMETNLPITMMARALPPTLLPTETSTRSDGASEHDMGTDDKI